MTVQKDVSEFALSVLSDQGLLDATGRLIKPALTERIVPIITTDHVVNEPSQGAVMKVGFTKTETPMLFLGVPDKHWTAVEDGGDEVELAGMEYLSQVLWSETSTSGSVQQALPGRFILCRGRGPRNMPTLNGGFAPQNMLVTFVTEDARVANVYYNTQVIGTLVRKAESVTKQLDLAIERMPENAETVAALLSPAVHEAVNKLSQITERAGLQLTVSSDGKLAIVSGDGKKAS